MKSPAQWQGLLSVSPKIVLSISEMNQDGCCCEGQPKPDDQAEHRKKCNQRYPQYFLQGFAIAPHHIDDRPDIQDKNDEAMKLYKIEPIDTLQL